MPSCLRRLVLPRLCGALLGGVSAAVSQQLQSEILARTVAKGHQRAELPKARLLLPSTALGRVAPHFRRGKPLSSAVGLGTSPRGAPTPRWAHTGRPGPRIFAV